LSIGFQVLDFVDTIAVYRSVYFIGTFIPVLIMILGQVINLQGQQENQE
jgi:hypothetical protein